MIITRKLLLNILKSAPLRRDKEIALMTRMSLMLKPGGDLFNQPFLEVIEKKAIIYVKAETVPLFNWKIKIDKRALIDTLQEFKGEEVDISYEKNSLILLDRGEDNTILREVVIERRQEEEVI